MFRNSVAHRCMPQAFTCFSFESSWERDKTHIPKAYEEFVATSGQDRGRRHWQCTILCLVILSDRFQNTWDYCKLGVRVRLSISAGVQVKRGRCGNHARRILHQWGATSRSCVPTVAEDGPLSFAPPKLSYNKHLNKSQVYQVGSKFEFKFKLVMGSVKYDARIDNIRWPKLLVGENGKKL